MNYHIFRAYDIRGIADPDDGQSADLTEETVYLIGKGAGTYLQQKYEAKSITVGRDNRLTGPTLQKAYMKGLANTGLNVTDIGLAISPMVYWASCAMDFDAATNITASHNPKQYNGIKIVSKDAHSICGDELQEVRKIIEEEKFMESEVPGKISEIDIRQKYMEDLVSRIKLEKKLKVVVDAGNGTATLRAA